MENEKDKPGSFLKVWYVDFFFVRLFLFLPIIVMVTLFTFQGTIIKLDDPIVLILILIYYISLIPLLKIYTHYRDKRDSQKRIEQRDLEERVWKKSLRK